MPGLGHLPEILLICLVALVILGPKRMIDMGSALGRALRELREATKDLNWSSLLDSGESSTSQRTSTTQRTSATLGAISQFTQSLTQSVKEMGSSASSSTPAPSPATPPTNQAVIDSSVVNEQSGDRPAGIEDEA
jgi:sec-independent protein translocase protein TatA